MSATTEPKKEKFAPKEPVTLQPPKADIIDREYLAKCDGKIPPVVVSVRALTSLGTNEGFPTLVAIKVSRLYHIQ